MSLQSNELCTCNPIPSELKFHCMKSELLITKHHCNPSIIILSVSSTLNAQLGYNYVNNSFHNQCRRSNTSWYQCQPGAVTFDCKWSPYVCVHMHVVCTNHCVPLHVMSQGKNLKGMDFTHYVDVHGGNPCVPTFALYWHPTHATARNIILL